MQIEDDMEVGDWLGRPMEENSIKEQLAMAGAYIYIHVCNLTL